MAKTPAEEMRAFIDEVSLLAPLTVTSDPDENVPTTVKIGATEKLNEISDAAIKHGLLLTYDGSLITVLPEAENKLPDEELPAL